MISSSMMHFLVLSPLFILAAIVFLYFIIDPEKRFTWPIRLTAIFIAIITIISVSTAAFYFQNIANN